MTKIYVIAPWGSGKAVHDGLRKLTPDSSGKWVDIETCDEFDQADYYVALWCGDPVLRKECRPHSVINVMLEASGRIPSPHELGEETVTSQWVTEDHNPVDWWVGKTYSELVKSPFPEKTKLVSYITTGRYVSRLRVLVHPLLKKLDQTFPSLLALLPRKLEPAWKIGREGHYYRLQFLKRFTRRFPGVLDLYGENIGGFDLSTMQDYKGPLKDKWEGLAPYRYAFAFECTSERNYFSEKLTDCILSGCMPLYWGCRNLTDFLPENSFFYLDITRADAVEKAMKVVLGDSWEKNLDDLREAKDLILDKYQFWPTIQRIVQGLSPHI